MSSIPIGEPLLDTKFEIHNEDTEIADKGELYIGKFLYLKFYIKMQFCSTFL